IAMLRSAAATLNHLRERRVVVDEQNKYGSRWLRHRRLLPRTRPILYLRGGVHKLGPTCKSDVSMWSEGNLRTRHALTSLLTAAPRAGLNSNEYLALVALGVLVGLALATTNGSAG